MARARRRPGRWLLTVAGIALATGFAGAVAVEATVAANQSARAVLGALAPAQRAIRVSSPAAADLPAAATMLRPLSLRSLTQVVLLNPVRLDGIVVRLAALAPLRRWTGADAPGACLPSRCPLLLASAVRVPANLSAAGVRLSVAGHGSLSSAAPLGFVPAAGEPPLLISGDTAGLAALPGLSGIYRSYDLVGLVPVAALQSWQLAGYERRLAATQAQLQDRSNQQVSLSGPFDALDAARAEAAAAPRRLLLAGGGALAGLALFVVLAAGALRGEVGRELDRLRAAGAGAGQGASFVIAEAGLACGAGLLLGAGVALTAGVVLADAGGAPVGGVLSHSLLRPEAVAAALAGWLSAVALVSVTLLAREPRLLDGLALAALAALALALTSDGGGSSDELAVLLAPLGCLAGGVLVFRLCGVLLVALERVLRRGPVLGRLAVVGLARAPTAPALAIAFIALSAGLGGFALSYRATLRRGAADEAAQRVPLDAIVSTGNGFGTPLQLAPAARWHALAPGGVFAVRRTYASFASGSATATVAALGVPAAALGLVHGWRASDSSPALGVLARRLAPPGAVREPGPQLPPSIRWLELRGVSTRAAVTISANLRAADGTVRTLTLGTTAARPVTLRARMPLGRYELEAISLSESAGLQATNGHQNAENPAAVTQFAATVTLGPMSALDAGGRRRSYALSDWRAVGAARLRGGHSADGELRLRFALDGSLGLLRPVQPSDRQPVPVLSDPATAANAGPTGRLAMTVDGVPVAARIAGTLTRFPTIAAGSGFVVADEATLAAALDAGLPGQGRPDELWIAAHRLGRLRAALRGPPLSQLGASFRADIERGLDAAPIARGVLGTLVAASLLAATLAVLGLLVALLGSGRDRRLERDLLGEGAGPRWLARELRVRVLGSAMAGVVFGLAIAAALARLAVGAVRAAGVVDAPQPPLIAVVPWGQLIAFLALLAVGLAGAAWLGTVTAGRRSAG